MNLIGITGRLHAGKDTAAQVFIDNGYVRESFADPLKSVVALLADENVQLYHDPVTKEEYSPMLGMVRRNALQLVGTDGVRVIFGADFWARRLLTLWERDDRPATVITDCRFDNEAEAIRAVGGVVIRIVRPDNDADKFGVAGHVSEAGVSDHLVDYTIVNDGTVHDLHWKVGALIVHLESGL
jgi:hypothetical protein